MQLDNLKERETVDICKLYVYNCKGAYIFIQSNIHSFHKHLLGPPG